MDRDALNKLKFQIERAKSRQSAFRYIYWLFYKEFIERKYVTMLKNFIYELNNSGYYNEKGEKII